MIRNLSLVLPILLLTVIPARAADFVHSDHVANPETPTCAICHLPEATSIQPEWKVCLECHEQTFLDEVTLPGLRTHGPVWALDHRLAARSKDPDCAACHEQKFCLDCHQVGPADQMGSFSNAMVNVHRSDFHVTHPIAARTKPKLCSTCHESKFCSECHNDFAPADLALLSHRRGFSNLVGGLTEHKNYTEDRCQECHIGSVLPTHEWSRSHAREARKNLATCQACHPEGDVCMKCHSAVSGLKINPHPKDWDSMKDRLSNASDGRTCRKCH